VIASDASGQVALHIRVANKGAQQASQQFEAHFNKIHPWKTLPDMAEDRIEEMGQIQVEKFLYAGDDPVTPSHSLFYSSTVNVADDSFLGSAILAKNLLQLSPKDLQTLLLMEACVELAGFRMD
jgi:hypothetical protein